MNEVKKISLEEFKNLRIVEKTEKRVKKVDWSLVIEELISKKQVFDFKTFKEVVLRLNKAKTSLNYSEMYRILESLKKQENIVVDCRKTQDDRIVYLVTRKKKEETTKKT